MRLDGNVLNEIANAWLRIFGVELHAEVSVQLMSITNFSAGPVTQDAGGFGAEGAGSVDAPRPVITRTGVSPAQACPLRWRSSCRRAMNGRNGCTPSDRISASSRLMSALRSAAVRSWRMAYAPGSSR